MESVNMSEEKKEKEKEKLTFTKGDISAAMRIPCANSYGPKA